MSIKELKYGKHRERSFSENELENFHELATSKKALSIFSDLAGSFLPLYKKMHPDKNQNMSDSYSSEC